MPADYSVLASIYDTINMQEFGKIMIERIVNFAQRNAWMGRYFIDIGCGTGASIKWLAENSFTGTGIDISSQMLEQARENLSAYQTQFQLVEQDIRQLDNLNEVDMVVSLNVMNDLDNIRDLEATFKSAHSLLRSEKWFVFDMLTIEGLIERYLAGDAIMHDDADLIVFSSNQFDYDRQIQKRSYTIFKHQGDLWQRQQAERTLRAYPVQAIASLLQRSGFSIAHVLNLDFARYEPGASKADRIIFMAQKQ